MTRDPYSTRFDGAEEIGGTGEEFFPEFVALRSSMLGAGGAMLAGAVHDELGAEFFSDLGNLFSQSAQNLGRSFALFGRWWDGWWDDWGETFVRVGHDITSSPLYHSAVVLAAAVAGPYAPAVLAVGEGVALGFSIAYEVGGYVDQAVEVGKAIDQAANEGNTAELWGIIAEHGAEYAAEWSGDLANELRVQAFEQGDKGALTKLIVGQQFGQLMVLEGLFPGTIGKSPRELLADSRIPKQIPATAIALEGASRLMGAAEHAGIVNTETLAVFMSDAGEALDGLTFQQKAGLWLAAKGASVGGAMSAETVGQKTFTGIGKWLDGQTGFPGELGTWATANGLDPSTASQQWTAQQTVALMTQTAENDARARLDQLLTDWANNWSTMTTLDKGRALTILKDAIQRYTFLSKTDFVAFVAARFPKLAQAPADLATIEKIWNDPKAFLASVAASPKYANDSWRAGPPSLGDERNAYALGRAYWEARGRSWDPADLGSILWFYTVGKPQGLKRWLWLQGAMGRDNTREARSRSDPLSYADYYYREKMQQLSAINATKAWQSAAKAAFANAGGAEQVAEGQDFLAYLDQLQRAEQTERDAEAERIRVAAAQAAAEASALTAASRSGILVDVIEKATATGTFVRTGPGDLYVVTKDGAAHSGQWERA